MSAAEDSLCLITAQNLNEEIQADFAGNARSEITLLIVSVLSLKMQVPLVNRQQHQNSQRAC